MMAALQLGPQKNEILAGPVQSFSVSDTRVYINL